MFENVAHYFYRHKHYTAFTVGGAMKAVVIIWFTILLIT